MKAWPEVGEILLEAESIQNRVAEMGRRISQDYKGRSPLFVCILRGAALFCSDLIRHVDLPLRLDFIALSSYGASTKSSGEVRLIKDLESSIEKVDVILVEDIVDTGLTLSYLIHNLENRGPASLKVCTLLSKPDRRLVDVQVDYIGFDIPDKFVVGYGLDFNQHFRNLPYIGVYNGEPDDG
ncbi:MAG: hypoxanthine phosphoribosyltransferase [Acidobacteriota bacterium]